jgi:hypothetical protein
MLTLTETITRELTAPEKMDLDNRMVCENLIQALESQDKEMAKQYALVLMLKATCM